MDRVELKQLLICVAIALGCALASFSWFAYHSLRSCAPAPAKSTDAPRHHTRIWV